MKYVLTAILILCISVGITKAQKSIGFTDKDDIKPILDYRLPDWGYSNFVLNVTANSTGDRRDFGDINISDGAHQLSLVPGYTLFRESEERIFELSTSLNVGYNGSNRKVRSPFDNSKTSDDVFSTDLFLNSTIREYVASEGFIFGEIPIRLNYRNSKFLDTQNSNNRQEVVNYGRFFTAAPRLGYGFGRVRNVSPVIRALRLKERYSALKTGSQFNNEDILRAADQFTRIEGYQRTYDRPEKYFWDDLDKDISTGLGSLNAYDLLYLTDVFDEAIGTRQEGWEVIGGVQFDYSNNLNRREERVANFFPETK